MKQQPIIPIDAIVQSMIPTAEIPSAVEVEQAVLGLLLIESSAHTEQAMLQLSSESFFDDKCRTTFEAIRKVESRGAKVDLYTVGQQLKDDRELRQIGGMAYLVGLTQKVGSGINTDTHISRLLQCQIGRRLAQNSFLTMRRILEGGDIGEALAVAQSDLERAMTVGLVDSHRRHISDIVVDTVAELRVQAEKVQSGKVTGVLTGLTELDRMTNGWQPSQLIILAARPAMGKTALMLHFAISAAESGVPVCVYSLEMSATSLAKRLLLAMCEVSSENLRGGRLSTSEWEEIRLAEEKLKSLPIYIDDKGGVSMRYISTHSKIMSRRGQCGLVLIDYLQLMDVRTAEKGRNREQEVAQCSKAAKELAKEIGAPVIMLAQLNRAVEGRGGKEPMLSDLRESGSIEQDADIVLFPHRKEYYTDKEYDEVKLSNGQVVTMPIKGLGKLIIAKQRDGVTGSLKFGYNSSLTHFRDFDERPYLSHTPASVRSRDNVSSGSINYMPAQDETDTLPF